MYIYLIMIYNFKIFIFLLINLNHILGKFRKAARDLETGQRVAGSLLWSKCSSSH
jgi:hypothetical protein